MYSAGYLVRTEPWGLHNVTIASIFNGGVELIPHDRVGCDYDDPRSYLPSDIITLLDLKLPDNGGGPCHEPAHSPAIVP